MTFRLEENQQFVVADPGVFNTILDQNTKLPMFEDEDGERLWGYGHIEPKLFAALATAYDLYFTGGDEYPPYTPESVKHGLAVAYGRIGDPADEFHFHKVDPEDIPEIPAAYGNAAGKSEDSEFYFPLTWIDR